jgi:hypothetical protein
MRIESIDTSRVKIVLVVTMYCTCTVRISTSSTIVERSTVLLYNTVAMYKLVQFSSCYIIATPSTRLQYTYSST